MFEISSYALGFQHFPRDLTNVYEWKIMFDPSIEKLGLSHMCSFVIVIRSSYFGAQKRRKYAKSVGVNRSASVPQIKYLGVNISQDLKWNSHINSVSSKANQTLGFLKRNLNINSQSIKEKAYK